MGRYRLGILLGFVGFAAAARAEPAPTAATGAALAPLSPLASPPEPAQVPRVLTLPPLTLANPPPALAPHPGRTAKTLALVSAGAAVVAASVAIYTWRTYSGLEDTVHRELVGLRPAAVNASQAHFFTSPTCSPPAGIDGSSAAQRYKQDCQRGQMFADATTALWAVAGTLVAGGLVAYIVGDRQAAQAHEKSSRILRQTLRFAPVVSTVGGGLQAAFEF